MRTALTDSAGFFTIQRLIWPDPRLNQEGDLYMRRPAHKTELPTAPLVLKAKDEAWFDTYFNLFSLGKWRRHCALGDLHLAVWGSGRVRLVIGCDTPGKPRQIVLERALTLRAGSPARVDLTPALEAGRGPGTLWFALVATRGTTLQDAAWQTRQAPQRIPDLTIAITTFQRESAVRASVARFETFAAQSELADHLHMIVVDNGQSAQIAASSHVTALANENLGGAGGFARGLIEARARRSSHCLFMDDDATVHMESIERTWRFLAWASDPKTAVAGAMSIAAHKWALWENGALFDSHCIPLHLGTDLRDAGQVAALDFASTAEMPPNHYGGWWYFAFPVAHAHHMPFPFFVRGDDISFGLVHDFNTVTLPGVLSFQDQDFADRESLNTLYLDLRNHLAHHLALPDMDIGRRRTLRIAWWFFARSAVQLHYETLAALNLSFADAMAGPDFFAAHADMATRRADLAGLRHVEAWRPIPQGASPPRPRRWINPDNRHMRRLMQITLNGHLLPFFRLYGNHIVLEPGQRGQLHPCWGAARVTYWDARAGQFFIVTHSKRRFGRAVLGLLANSWSFWHGYARLKHSWQIGYGRLTTPEWWQRRLGLTRPGV